MRSMYHSEFISKLAIWGIPRLQDALPSWAFKAKNLKFRVYCVGAPKTGTTTIGEIFSQQYRSQHEPEASLALAKILAFLEGKSDKNDLIRYLKHRDRRLGLEMDTSHLNYPLIDILLNEYEDAKFILTLRDCYSWLDSLLNHHLPLYRDLGHRREFQNRKWIRYNKHIFKADKFQHTQEEKILSDHYLYTLRGYFSYWAEHNRNVISTIPKEKILIIKTKNINQDLYKIEDFMNISQNSLPRNIYKNVRDSTQKFKLLSKIDRNFLEETANQYCQDLMHQYFPEIRTAQDAGIGSVCEDAS